MASRQRQRAADIAESYYLLLELSCCEPIIQQAFGIIESVCLAHGVTATASGRATTPDFQQHIDRYWVPFLKSAIRVMHTTGFVAWRQCTLPSGDKIPEVLPLGTYRWSVEVSEKNNAMLSYRVQLNPESRKEDNIRITQFTPPNYMVSENSIMYATVSSPMSYVIESYKNMQGALKRQNHADAWNCTARVVVANDPKEFSHDQHRKELFGTLGLGLSDVDGPAANPRALQPSHIDEIFYERSMNHVPAVYALPPYHRLDPAPPLQPCADLPYLASKYKYDVCSLLGIPPDMLMTAHKALEGGGADSSKSRMGGGANRIFQAKMQSVCYFLRTLATEVYETIYKGATATFDIIPMPRLEISGIEDLKILHEIGVIQPEHTIELASLLMGKLKKRKRQDVLMGGPGGASGDKGPKEGGKPTKDGKPPPAAPSIRDASESKL
jgi:hypothetical protein